MEYESGDYPNYPGSDIAALKVDFESLRLSAQEIGVTVTLGSGGSFFSPRLKRINIDTKSRTARGFVSVGQLTDEYFHAWNENKDRGRYLTDRTAAEEHVRLGRIAAASGTRSLGTQGNIAFHKLEALNFIASDARIPTFVWRIPDLEMHRFASSWRVHME